MAAEKGYFTGEGAAKCASCFLDSKEDGGCKLSLLA